MSEVRSIADLIPFGFDNAIERRDLVIKAEQFGFAQGVTLYEMDRHVRRLIQKERINGTVILYRNEGGYYRPTNKDVLHIRKYIRMEKGRAFTLINEVKHAERLLQEIADGMLIGETDE